MHMFCNVSLSEPSWCVRVYVCVCVFLCVCVRVRVRVCVAVAWCSILPSLHSQGQSEGTCSLPSSMQCRILLHLLLAHCLGHQQHCLHACTHAPACHSNMSSE